MIFRMGNHGVRKSMGGVRADAVSGGEEVSGGREISGAVTGGRLGMDVVDGFRLVAELGLGCVLGLGSVMGSV